MTRLYVVVRGDLPVGLQMAQACHVARRFVPAAEEDENLVVLTVPNEARLWSLLWNASRHAEIAAFTEPDIADQLTAIALRGSGVQKLVRELPLAGADRPTLSDLTS